MLPSFFSLPRCYMWLDFWRLSSKSRFFYSKKKKKENTKPSRKIRPILRIDQIIGRDIQKTIIVKTKISSYDVNNIWNMFCSSLITESNRTYTEYVEWLNKDTTSNHFQTGSLSLAQEQ